MIYETEQSDTAVPQVQLSPVLRYDTESKMFSCPLCFPAGCHTQRLCPYDHSWHEDDVPQVRIRFTAFGNPLSGFLTKDESGAELFGHPTDCAPLSRKGLPGPTVSRTPHLPRLSAGATLTHGPSPSASAHSPRVPTPTLTLTLRALAPHSHTHAHLHPPCVRTHLHLPCLPPTPNAQGLACSGKP